MKRRALRTLGWVRGAALRTFHAALPGTASPDDLWAKQLLPPAELGLFMQLSAPERSHAVAVARRVLAARPGASGTLLRAALLHDIGKLGSSGNVWWRIAAHLLPAPASAAEPRLTGLAGVRQARKFHPEYGAALVLATGGDPAVAELIRRHHDPGSDADARLLQACDAVT